MTCLEEINPSKLHSHCSLRCPSSDHFFLLTCDTLIGYFLLKLWSGKGFKETIFLNSDLYIDINWGQRHVADWFLNTEICAVVALHSSQLRLSHAMWCKCRFPFVNLTQKEARKLYYKQQACKQMLHPNLLQFLTSLDGSKTQPWTES